MDDDGNGVPNHVTRISRVTGKTIKYAAHSNNRYDRDVKDYFSNNKHKVYILKMKQKGNVLCELR